MIVTAFALSARHAPFKRLGDILFAQGAPKGGPLLYPKVLLPLTQRGFHWRVLADFAGDGAHASFDGLARLFLIPTMKLGVLGLQPVPPGDQALGPDIGVKLRLALALHAGDELRRALRPLQLSHRAPHLRIVAHRRQEFARRSRLGRVERGAGFLDGGLLVRLYGIAQTFHA